MFCKGFWESTLFLSMEPWAFYMIRNGNSTYAGISTDVDRRLRQHNGEIRGGARYTTGRGPGWKHLCVVRGFQNQNQALMFEWAVKHAPPRRERGLGPRIRKFYDTLCADKWTSRSPNARDVPLSIHICDYESFSCCAPRALPSYISYE